jgi:glutamine amidotransferase-like uncharacterized protein
MSIPKTYLEASNYYSSMGRLRLLFWLVPFFATACTMSEPTAPDILLFNGRGTSPNDVAALERILRERHSSYSTASSERLGAMSEVERKAYRLLIIPGGNFEEIGNALTVDTTARLRKAVRGGLNYLGICAGAFFAGDSPYNGLNLTSGVRFPFYALEHQGIRKAAVAITTADAPPLEVYWEDGRQLTGWGEVVARYPDNTAAVVQGSLGEGWVVLTGVHAEAPESWRRDLAFTTPVARSHAFVARLIDAALHRTPLPRH